MDLKRLNQKIQTFQHPIQNAFITTKEIQTDPFAQFVEWFEQSLTNTRTDPNAMVLSTVDDQGWPDSRIVLLKELEPNVFIFFTNYNSKKGRQLSKNNVAALNFYWPELVRQIRIRGTVEKTTQEKSQQYFATRNRLAQLSACVSNQSCPIKDDDEIVKNIKILEKSYVNATIPCPSHWGGYALTAFEYEFFQGQQGRIHDRFFYFKEKNQWKIQKLAP